MIEFEPHDYFTGKSDRKVSREIFQEHIRKTYDQIRELADYIEQYEGTIDTEFEKIVTHVNEKVKQLTDLYNDLLDNNVLDSAIQDKLLQLEEEYAPKLTQVTAQLQQKAKQQWVDVTQPPFNAKGDGITDDTLAIKLATSFATTNNKKLYFPEGFTFLINTFDDLLDDGLYTAVKITGNISIIGKGNIKSDTTQVNNSIFAIDSTSGNVEFELEGLGFLGSNRYRVVYTTANSEAKSVKIKNNTTSMQSMILIGKIKKSIEVTDNFIGVDIESTTNISPTLNVSLPVSNPTSVNYRVSNNIVRTGTQVISSGAYVIHGMPIGGECIGNNHYNVGMVANEGYDIDNLGKFAKFCRNTSYGSGFEYKVGTEGHSNSRDIIFSENISYNAVSVAFAIQSSCIGFGNVAYNPSSWGLYLHETTDVDGLLDKSSIQLNGFRIIYAGASWSGAVRLSGGFKSVSLENLSIELDPLWNKNNPSTPIGGGTLIIGTGDLNNVTLRNIFIARSQFDMINFRPTTSADNIILENIHFDESCGDSCFDLINCNNVKIINPKFPPTITDRPIRLSTCNNVKIECDFHEATSFAQTSGNNTGVLINNWGQESTGVGVTPSSDSRWAIGSIVTNTSDGTVWLRVSPTTTPASAWKQLA